MKSNQILWANREHVQKIVTNEAVSASRVLVDSLQHKRKKAARSHSCWNLGSHVYLNGGETKLSIVFPMPHRSWSFYPELIILGDDSHLSKTCPLGWRESVASFPKYLGESQVMTQDLIKWWGSTRRAPSLVISREGSQLLWVKVAQLWMQNGGRC